MSRVKTWTKMQGQPWQRLRRRDKSPVPMDEWITLLQHYTPTLRERLLLFKAWLRWRIRRL